MECSNTNETSRDSKLLSQLCRDVGFSQEKWRERLEISDADNTYDNYKHMFSGFRYLHSGSSGEGVAMDFLNSDLDVMFVFKGTSVIEGTDVETDEPDHMYQMVKTNHPAFVGAQLLSVGSTEDRNNEITLGFCEVDETGRFVLSSGEINCRSLPEGDSRHGPALRYKASNVFEVDKVVSLHCRSWPSASDEWLHRYRPFNWPRLNSIQEIANSGCELVPVGSHRSRNPHLEFRLSSSMAEKLLVRSFNITQIQCYFLLKLILTFLIKPVISDKLCSYHMKTIMLYAVETTNPAIWREDNLTNCFMTCLKTLLLFLKSGFCPQYFIPQHNLFDPKVQGETRRILVRIVTDLVAEGWRCVLRCLPFRTTCQHREPRCPCHILKWEEKKMCDHLMNHLMVCINFHVSVHSILSERCCGTVEEAVSALLISIKKGYCPCKETTLAFQFHLKVALGLVLLHSSRFNGGQVNHRLMYYAMRTVGNKKGTPSVSCKLKYATFLYMIKETQRCVQVVRKILSQYGDRVPFSIDTERRRGIYSQPGSRRYLREITLQCINVKSSLSRMIHQVVFSKWEIKSCPHAIRHVAETRELLTVEDHRNFSLLFVDAVVMAHYLLFMCYADMNKPAESRRSLETLRNLADFPINHYIFYPDVTRLLYEHCRGHM